MTKKQIQEVKARVLLDWADRELERNKKKKIQNEKCLRYAEQERAIKNGTYAGPAPRRLNILKF